MLVMGLMTFIGFSSATLKIMKVDEKLSLLNLTLLWDIKM